MSTIRPKWNGEYIAEAVRRHNAIAEGLALAVLEVSALLNGSKITGDQVGKKVKDAINVVLKKHMPSDIWARCYLDTQYTYTLYLKADFNSPVSGDSEGYHTVAYSETCVEVARKGDGVWIGVSGSVPGTMSARSVVDAIQSAIDKADIAYKADRVAMEARQACGGFVI